MSRTLRRSGAAALFAFLVVSSCPALSLAVDDPAVSLAEQTITARYEAAQLVQDKKTLEQNVIGRADQVLKSVPDRLKNSKAALEKAQQERDAAAAALAEKQAAAKAAREQAESSNSDDDKQAAQKAAQELTAAERTAQQKENSLKQATQQVERETQQIEQAKADKAAAQEAIPAKVAAAKEAGDRADQLRASALAAQQEHAWGQQPLTIAGKIDKLIDSQLTQAKIPASPQTSDGEFLRRASLDIVGRIPTYDEVVAFLDDQNPNKRAAAVDRLLASEEYGLSFGTIFCDLTTDRATSTVMSTKGHFSTWLAESLNLNRRWDRVVRDMLAAEGKNVEQPGGIFVVAYLTNSQPDPAMIIGTVGELFLGLDIKCAQCHQHPFVDEWSEDEFWGMAAMFSRVRVKGQITGNPNGYMEFVVTDEDVPNDKDLVRTMGVKYPPPLAGGKIAIPDPTDPNKTLREVSAKLLDGVTPQLPEKGFYRRDFAQWLTSSDNPYFVRATVNRLWSHFFSRGLVNPLTHMTVDNKPSHPEVLTLLDEEFKNSGFDLKHLIRVIVGTEAYQRSSRPLEENAADETLYSHMAIKTLQADALLDSLTVAIGRPVQQAGDRRRTSKELFATRLPDGDPLKFTHSIPQILRLMNAGEYNDSGTIIQKATDRKSLEESVTGLYLAALSRQPTAAEQELMQKYVSEAASPRAGYADVYWVLLNSAEFLVNH